MNARFVLHALGWLNVGLGIAMIPALGWALAANGPDSWALAWSALIAVALGLAMVLATRGTFDGNELRHRDGFAIVALGWLTLSLVGSLPFMLAGALPGLTDAFFETASGFTTTGATVLRDVESLPRGLLFWRSMTHWLGGMGIIVLALAILPLLRVGGMQLFRAEVPGPTKDKLAPRIQSTAKLLWSVYFLLSAVQTLLLVLGGLPLFEALCHTFGTVATGGFSTRNASIGAYQSAYVDWVVIVFMLAAGMNFSLLYRLLHGKVQPIAQDPELRFYLTIVVVASAVIALDLGLHGGLAVSTAVRTGAFQVVSITTTTGYATADFESWPGFTQAVLLLLFFFGGCGGSTGGGVKQVRVLLLFKSAALEFRRLLHPQAVVQLKLGQVHVPEDVVSRVRQFFLLYVMIAAAAFLVLTLLGLDLWTAFAAVIATLGNIGPGFGAVGPMDNYAHLPDAAKWLLAFLMFLGRLELYTVLILFTKGFWRV